MRENDDLRRIDKQKESKRSAQLLKVDESLELFTLDFLSTGPFSKKMRFHFYDLLFVSLHP